MLAVEEHWKILPGHAFGARQPVMLGCLRLPAAGCPAAARVDEAFQRLVGPRSALVATPPEPAALAGWLLTWARHLEQAARIPAFQVGQVAGVEPAGPAQLRCHVVLPYFRSGAALACLRWVVHTAAALMAADTQALQERAYGTAAGSLEQLRAELVVHASSSVNTDRILRAALEHDIPFEHIEGETFLFGQGRHSRWLFSTFTDRTGNLGARFARRKDLTSQLLADHGLPVAAQHFARSADEAVERARQLGYPVVVKPADRDGGEGVHAGLRSDEQVRRCYEEACRHSASILVERHHDGRDYRLTVLHGRLIKAIERVPGGVTGDGHRSIRALLEAAVELPDARRRARERGRPLLALDEEATEMLAQQGLAPDDAPAPGRFVALRRRANVSSGGSTRLVTDEVHPDNRRLAERAAQALRLDVAGVDLIIPDITRSWLDTGAIVCEVNAQPQLGENHTPGLYGQFLHELLGGDGRIPVALVLLPGPGADEGHTDLAPIVQAFSGGAPGTAVAAPGGMWLDGERWSAPDTGWFDAARAALHCREAERAVLAATPELLWSHGLPGDRLDLLVVWPAPPGARGAGGLAAIARAVMPHLRGPMIHAAHDSDAQALAQALPAARRVAMDLRDLPPGDARALQRAVAAAIRPGSTGEDHERS